MLADWKVPLSFDESVMAIDAVVIRRQRAERLLEQGGEGCDVVGALGMSASRSRNCFGEMSSCPAGPRLRSGR
jgi:hypothetical protein